MNEFLTIIGVIAAIIGVYFAYQQLVHQKKSGEVKPHLNHNQNIVVINNKGQEATISDDEPTTTNNQLKNPPITTEGDSLSESDYLKFGVDLTKAMKPTDKLELNEGTL